MAVAVVSLKTDKSDRRRLRLLLASVIAFTTCSFRNHYTVDRRSVCNKYRPKMYELALLTSLWVDSNRWRKHRVEVLKALSINVRNPHLSVIYVQRKKGVTQKRIEKAFRNAYREEPFVRLKLDGACPTLKDVQHTNFCDIGFQLDAKSGQVIIITAIDNLLKGASGQAVQNMNVRCAFPESEGL